MEAGTQRLKRRARVNSIMNAIVSPIIRRLTYFFFIRRAGIGGKVVTLTELLIQQAIVVSKPAVLMIPNRFFWLPIAISGMLTPSAFARTVSFEHAKFFRTAPSVGPNLTKKALRQCNSRYLRASIVNFMIRFHWYGADRRGEVRKEGVPVPITYLISPTMRCNLHCRGCYAAMYETKDDLPFEVIDRVVTEAKDMGMYNVFIVGGEPFIRKDMLDIYKKHSDIFFMVFTNGTFFDDELAEKLSRLGNVVPYISIEGFERETDNRRGKGTFQKVMQGMDNLRRKGVPFGYSSMVTRFNVDTVISDEFNDMLINKGCLIGWHFLYIPVGNNPNPRLMPTPEQRLKMLEYGGERIRTFKPILTIDFWNDAPFTNGCIAGGQNYFHINSAGDMEPCIFVHFATDNVKEKSLRECLKSPFFKAFRDRQPYSQNLLRPCAIMDHPHILREILAEHQPYPTHPESDVLVTKCAGAMDRYSEKIAELFDPVWEQEFGSKGYECEFFASVLRHCREKYLRDKGSSREYFKLEEHQELSPLAVTTSDKSLVFSNPKTRGRNVSRPLQSKDTVETKPQK